MICITILSRSAAAAETSWESEVIDSGLGLGAYSSLKVGPGDQVHISYFVGSTGAVKHAFFDGSSWTTETVDQTWGPSCSLALDSAGRPRIAYWYYEGHGIRYAVREDGGTWTFSDFETDDDEETYIAMVLDNTDGPHVSYYDGYHVGQPHDLKYAYLKNDFWNAVVVDAGGQVGRGSSLGLDSRNLPHISYYDETNVRLKYAYFDATRWVVNILDDVEYIGPGFRTAIVVDSRDRVHIVYSTYHYENGGWRGRLRYALLDGVQWTIVTLDEALPTRDFRLPAISVDGADHPHVSYLLYYNLEAITADLKYAWFDGYRWHIEDIDTGDISDSWSSNSIDVDSVGRPHVSHEREQSTLIHAVRPAPTAVEASTWGDIKTIYRQRMGKP